ncbi:AAA family ATPase [Dryocola sp. BD586]|uniref:AAA family ATPase n=1 Tax=Dryocola sp. BD586 TaxID=3133271 RepID=UPI003F50258C
MAYLTVRGVKSYAADRDVSFDLSSKVTLIYGQNGSGKSTVSGYFYDRHADQYRHCTFSSSGVDHFLVFNQEYIDSRFGKTDSQPGIFTLSEKNQGLQDVITKNQKQSAKIATELEGITAGISKRQQMLETVKDDCARKMFARTVNDRNRLGGFLERAKQTRSFYERMLSTPVSELQTTTETLEEKWHLLSKSEGTQVDELIMVSISGPGANVTELMCTPIVPANSTQFSATIAHLGNADWVHKGSGYIEGSICPFCQQVFDSEHFATEIGKMFDASYQDVLKTLSASQEQLAQDYKRLEDFERRVLVHAFAGHNSSLHALTESLKKSVELQLQQVLNKVKEPSQIILLENKQDIYAQLSDEVNALNARVAENNRLAVNFREEKRRLAAEVHGHLRARCEEYLAEQDAQHKEIRAHLVQLTEQHDILFAQKRALDAESSMLTGQLSEIQPTIDVINANLKLLGITGFEIFCHDSELKRYRLRRGSEPREEAVFRSLSEGEKTIIAFLYFLESCTGSVTPEAIPTDKKLIVIDDPISSLSHNYIYEVAALIKRKIITPAIAKHVVILTHNMFFFQEIILNSGRLQDNRSAPTNWSLMRIVKGEHSDCVALSMHEMLNDYQALWQTLKDVRDSKTQPIVLFNTMRNILEYYFSFACKQEKLRAALEMLAAQHSDAGEYDSFYRAINRHSHSDGRNILQTGIVDKERYFDMFRKIFKQTEDEEHYAAMMGEEMQQEQ